MAQGAAESFASGMVGWNSSIGLPAGSSTRICLPPTPVRISLRNRRGWREWAAAVRAALAGIAAKDADAVAITLAREFAARPLLCDLIPHTALNLERHAPIDAVRTYKLTSLGAVNDVAAGLEGPLPDLATEDRRQLASTVALLAGAMYQIATPRHHSPSSTAPTAPSGTSGWSSNPDSPVRRRSRSPGSSRYPPVRPRRNTTYPPGHLPAARALPTRTPTHPQRAVRQTGLQEHTWSRLPHLSSSGQLLPA